MKILVTGGAGYVGSALVPKLLGNGFETIVLDLFWYGEDVLDSVKENSLLTLVKGDLRDKDIVQDLCRGTDAIIHLACVSNDPSFDLDPKLGKSINYDATVQLVRIAKEKGVRRFIYASTSSVYGVKKVENVTEDLLLEPLTDYSKYKAACEKMVLEGMGENFIPLIIRPATVCGYSPRLRLDLTVNLLTCQAMVNKKLTVFGGEQKRPNIHIEDMTDLYCECLNTPEEKIKGEVFNAGYENHTVLELAKMVRDIVGEEVKMEVLPSDDLRSYHISSEKIKTRLGFKPKHTIAEAISDLKKAFQDGKVPNPLKDIRYYNIKTMKEKRLR